MMKHFPLILLALVLAVGCGPKKKTDAVRTETVTAPPSDRRDQDSPKKSAADGQPEDAAYEAPEEGWDVSVKGHVNPGSQMNNETCSMETEIWWDKRKGKGTVELVPALKPLGDSGKYVDIITEEPWESEYEGYGDSMWYLQVKGPYEVVEPLFLNYYFCPRFVYEGDLDQDGCPDFGILLRRESNCCAYALLTIENGHWALLTDPFSVAYNLRASGKELARKGQRKGDIRITKSGFDEVSTCMDAPIVDTVVVAQKRVIDLL